MKGTQNNFGFVRIVFAMLVVLSHSAELLDGNRSREILSGLFRTLSFGELAVDGFFLVSGFLITKSYLQSGTFQPFLVKRVLRIYPGFVVAYLFSLLVVGPLAGGSLHELESAEAVALNAARIASLSCPGLNGAFTGLPVDYLNGSMWTIRYEFGCYLLTGLLGLTGILRNRKAFAAVFLAALAVFVASKFLLPLVPRQYYDVWMQRCVRLLPIYLCGCAFFLFRESIPYRKGLGLAALACLLVLMRHKALAEPALAVFGGYLLFWFVFHCKSSVLAKVGGKVDLSYGVYLYAWPVQNLIISLDRSISPWALFGVSALVVCAMAYCSWTMVERPFLRLKNAFLHRPAPVPVTAEAGYSLRPELTADEKANG